MSDFVFSAGDTTLEPITVEFSDGTRELPVHIVRAVDAEQFKNAEYLAVLKQITWAKFLSTIEHEINKAALNSKFGAEQMLRVNRKQQRGY